MKQKCWIRRCSDQSEWWELGCMKCGVRILMDWGPRNMFTTLDIHLREHREGKR